MASRMYCRFLLRSLLMFFILMSAGADGGTQKLRKDYLKYSHLFHLEDTDLECEACHRDVKKSISSSDRLLPTHDACWACHDGNIARIECDVCHFDAMNVMLMPKNKRITNFSHKTHLEQEDNACNTCHVGMEKTDYSTAESIPFMPVCKRCHNSINAPENCSHCHLTPNILRPKHHNPKWLYSHAGAPGDLLPQCSMCHTFLFCKDCHTEAILKKPIPQKLADGTPVSLYNWDIKNVDLRYFHDLYYGYQHSALTEKEYEECKFCHGGEDYCNTCHLPVLPRSKKLTIIKK